MAKIVYGVSGEGSGHSSRAREMATFLLDQGHDVRLVSYDRGYRNLQEDFTVFETEGLTIRSKDNRVSLVETFTENLKRLPQGHRKLQQLRKELFKEFQPDVAITDFEPMTAYLSNHYKVPLISLDNQHRMRYLDYECPPDHRMESTITKNIIRAIVPKPDACLVTTFFFGATRNDHTHLFPPIVRSEVQQLTATCGDHILVYLTSGFESLLKELAGFQRESFRVYGYDRSDREGVLHYQPFSRQGFLADLATCKAIVATAGFTLISEALHLAKPYCACPMQGQFEQRLNAFQLGQLGYGKDAVEPSAESIGDFLYRLPDYRQALASYECSDNAAIKAKLAELIEQLTQQ